MNVQVDIRIGEHRLVADEPLGEGDGAGPDPYELLLSALGACTVMTVQMYARRKQWPLTGVEVRLNTFELYEKDVERSEGDPHARVDVIERHITFHGDLSAEQRARLRVIADHCPVHRTLTGKIRIQTTVE
jgi:putative redox protein